MKEQLWNKLKESIYSILPITLLVLIISITPLISLTVSEVITFILSFIFLVIGMTLFNLGAEVAMTPMGKAVGSSLTKKNNMWLLVVVCFCLGLFITIAEPDLQVLSSLVSTVINSNVFVIVVGVGVGLFIVVSILKIAFKKTLSSLLLFFYFLLFALTILVINSGNENFLALAFDSGGVTTGPITVPFIMALGIGIASTLGSKYSNENSFGLIALCSVGSIIGVMFLMLFINGDFTYTLEDYTMKNNVFSNFTTALIPVIKEVTISLGLLVLFFIIFQFTFLKLPKKKLSSIGIGILYTYFGLIFFLTAVIAGFMPIGYKIGIEIASQSKYLLIPFGLLMGLLVVLAEPAIHVLNSEVYEITNGKISKKSMMIGLCIGVALSIGLSMIRIIYDFSLMYYLVPGYIISLGLSFFVPPLYTGVAFDSGGVASGPLTSSFILPFAIGACLTLQGSEQILQDAFGIVAMVALTPLITIQLLGFKSVITHKVKQNIAINKLLASDDAEIINFK